MAWGKVDLCGLDTSKLPVLTPQRMQELYRRNKFNLHPAERKVREQFDDFIRNYQK